jgi:glycerol-3-phosphate O-acyltransferase
LIKSRSVLSEDYGSIYVNFGQLIPLSSCIEGKLDRMATASIPRYDMIVMH